MSAAPLRIILANPRSFCAGVIRAVEIVERALEIHGAPVYVRHEIVHNRQVVDDLRAKGAIFVADTDEIPDGALTVLSAHGVPRSVEAEAARRGLDVVNAACPLVLKVHNEGRRYAEKGYDVVLIGHADHPEVKGTVGQIDGPLHVVATVEEVAALDVADPEKVAYVTQTTLSLDDTQDVIEALKARFPAVVGPGTNDICYATQNRQRAVRDLAGDVDLIVVMGAANSSNSNRLREIGEAAGVRSVLLDRPELFDAAWLDGVDSLGLTAGASAPDYLVAGLIERLRKLRTVTVEERAGVPENVEFRPPARLLRPQEIEAAAAARMSREGRASA
jgi:4-hydroxy-3-methylbut-2-enyl diphosphate reductase